MTTIGVISGQWYWEFTQDSSNLAYSYLGINSRPYEAVNPDTTPGLVVSPFRSFIGSGNFKDYNSTTTLSGSFPIANNAVHGFALDMFLGTLAYYLNGGLLRTDFTVPKYTSGTVLYPMLAHTNSGVPVDWTGGIFNFGAKPFRYSIPSGFKPINALEAGTVI